LRQYWLAQAEAEASLRLWVNQAKAASWENFADVRRTISSADQLAVASGRTVVVFNIAHNRYRLITAIHYNRGIVYTLRLLTHKEYDRNAWKKQL
jgi:mRNA interferase HigB